LERLPDKRRGTNSTYRMVDFGMAAFSAFFMQCPSFLDDASKRREVDRGPIRSVFAQTLPLDEIIVSIADRSTVMVARRSSSGIRGGAAARLHLPRGVVRSEATQLHDPFDASSPRGRRPTICGIY
jgi:hypothetical protein